jgi:hypothetical protein
MLIGSPFSFIVIVLASALIIQDLTSDRYHENEKREVSSVWAYGGVEI